LQFRGSLGIIKSTDGGVTWSNVLTYYPWEDKTVYKLLVDPYHPQRIYALVNNLLLRNNNAGTGSWDTIFTCPPAGDIRRNLRTIIMKPSDPTTLYVAADCRKPDATSNNLAKAYKIMHATSVNPDDVDSASLDIHLPYSGGTILTQRYQIAVTPEDTSVIYICCQQIFFQPALHFELDIWKYDRIHSWKLWTYFSESEQDFNWDKLELLVSPEDTGVVYLGGNKGDDPFRKFKYGHGQTINQSNTHRDARFAKIYLKDPSIPGSHDVIFMGHDGGISKSSNGLLSCENLNGNGLVITQFWGIGNGDQNDNIIYGGTQDNNFYRYENGTWHRSGGGDMGNPLVDYSSPGTVFCPMWGDLSFRLSRSVNGGTSWETVFTPKPEDPYFNSNVPLDINPVNHKSIYIGCHNIWRFTNPDSTLTKIHIPFGFGVDTTAQAIRTFAVAPTDTLTLYVAYNGPYDAWVSKQREKFIRTKNGGADWTNLSEITNSFWDLLRMYGITDIEVSPTTPDHVWISFGGFWHQDDSYHHRVLFSPDGGQTWNNDTYYSKGLPNCPVNCLKYLKGGNGSLLAGTDMGVFYRDNDTPEWQPFNTGLPPCIVTDIEVDTTGQKIRIGTYGRGVYETDISCEFISEPWKIQSNTVISHDTTLSQRIEIDSSCTLTITARVKFPPYGMITVNPGARLVVNGGTLTSRCNNLWRGVRVLGRSDKPQNQSYQGSATFTGNSVIENARFGVTTNGGLITAENSVFRNNFNAVKFEYYSWQQNSVFKKVTFETTRKYLDTNYSVPQDLVTLWEVKGVKFLGCTFQNRTNNADNLPRSLDGRGIYSINASYTVDQYDHVPANGSFGDTVHELSSFKGLYYGIRACNSNPARSVKIDRTTFDHNYRGVYLGAADYSTVTRNTFLIPNHLQAGNDTCYGLYLGTCRRYHVEANQFYSPGNTLVGNSTGNFPLKNIGIIVDNSGGSVNEIYRNYFDTLDIAINAQRVNRYDYGTNSIDKGIPPHPIPAMPTGLVLKCNNYRNNTYDETITPGYNYGLEGIAKNQGANTAQGKDQAGNQFSPFHADLTGGRPESDIKNLAANITYYHHKQSNLPGAPRVKPVYYTTGSAVHLELVINNNFDSLLCCPSKLASPNKRLSILRILLLGESNILDSLANRLQSLVDDGNTDEMNDNIATSFPSDALAIRQDLLNSSPYLSDTVMKSAIERETVLPNEMIRDVLVANPQAAKTDDVLNTLNDRFISMPDSMLAEILEGRDQLSPKEALEAEIAMHLQYYSDAYNELVRNYLTDSTFSGSADSIVAFLESAGDLDGQYLLASTYLSAGDTVNMDRILNSIPESFVLDRLREREHQDYLTYFTFLKSLYSQNQDIYHLDSSQCLLLTTLCVEASEPVSSFARNILIASNIVDYFEPIFLPDDLKSTPGRDILRTSHFSKGCYLKIFPNPAKRYIIVEYNTSEVTSGESAILLTIASSDGKILETRTLTRFQDQQLIETLDYEPGLYLCRITSGKQVFVSGKFTIIH